MNLRKKKSLAAKVLNVGEGRIRFNKERLSDIKEALTKQDIRDLFSDKAITIKEIKGRLFKAPRNTRRRQGSIKSPVKRKKREYIIITRMLRRYLAELRRQGKISNDLFFSLRKEIRARLIKDKNHMKARIAQLQAEGEKKK